jgi:hypothetical protein
MALNSAAQLQAAGVLPSHMNNSSQHEAEHYYYDIDPRRMLLFGRSMLTCGDLFFF